MSEHYVKEQEGSEPSGNRLLFSVIGWLGFVFIFVAIVLIAYVPNRPRGVDQARVEYRMEQIRAIQSEQRRKVESYEVVSREEGIVRIPVNRARDLMVERLARREREEGR